MSKKGFTLIELLVVIAIIGILAATSVSAQFLAGGTNISLEQENKPVYLDPRRAVAERVDDLVARMTLEEKVSQMVNRSPAIDRLGIPQYDWWNECLHGVARAGIATVFPQAIGMAATWDVELVHRMAVVTSDEARAKYHDAVAKGIRRRNSGLTFWAPNINIFRDPRWGRGQETYGEDPYLTARVAVAFVRGLQGNDTRYLKVVSTPKHFAVHSGPEKDRHYFDARVSLKEMWETYLPAFEACVREAQAYSIMPAYNRTNGESCCVSQTLLEDILRNKWGFEGYVVSDCGSIRDLLLNHKLAKTREEAAAMGVKAGCDLNCGRYYLNLTKAVEQGLIFENEINRAVKRLFTARFKLGMFDPPEEVPYTKIPYEVVDCAEHRALALEAARKSIVLLKNEDGLLPLTRELNTVAIIGPNADSTDVLLGNYHGEPSQAVTVREGIRAALADHASLLHVEGCSMTKENAQMFKTAQRYATQAELIVFVGGLSLELEDEGGFFHGDRDEIGLPKAQVDLLKYLHKTGKPVILVLMSGSPVSIPWAHENIPAIVQAWYPGEEGGTAVADVLFGNYNPAGRLPVTVVKSLDQVPDFNDYSMDGRTYRYLQDEPLYPFGYGLSYTKLSYSNLRVDPGRGTSDDDVTVSVRVKNVGERAGDEVVQLYVTDLDASCRVPVRSLQGFKRVHLKPGEQKTVTFTLTPRQYALVDEQGRRVVEPGKFEVSVGGSQPGYDDLIDDTTAVLTGTFVIKGDRRIVDG